MANNLKNHLLKLFVVFNLIDTDFCDRNCQKIRLIQPLDPSTGLSYVVFSQQNYYMISNELLNDPNKPLEPMTITNYSDKFDNLDRLTAILVYQSSSCSPPKNILVAYTFIAGQSGSFTSWHTTLSMTGWSQSQNWSRPVMGLPQVIGDNEKIIHINERISFTMFWHKTKRLYLIVLPNYSGITSSYYTITRVSDNCTKDSFSLDSDGKAFTDILEPFGDKDCCFIHDDQQIICYGSEGFSSYNIDLEQSNDKRIRVKNKEKTVKRIPVMDIIEKIAKNIICDSEAKYSTTSATDTSITTAIDYTSDSDTEPTKQDETGSGLMGWLIWVIIVAVVMLVVTGIILVIWLFVFRNESKDKDLNKNKPEKEPQQKSTKKKYKTSEELELSRSKTSVK